MQGKEVEEEEEEEAEVVEEVVDDSKIAAMLKAAGVEVSAPAPAPGANGCGGGWGRGRGRGRGAAAVVVVEEEPVVPKVIEYMKGKMVRGVPLELNYHNCNFESSDIITLALLLRDNAITRKLVVTKNTIGTVHH
jgi:hypothetical protein